MVKTILRLAKENPILKFVEDQIGYPTFAGDAAAMTRLLVDQERSGLYHVTNQGQVSWFEFAQEVLISAGLDPERVEPITTASLNPPRPAQRPANSCLENAALKRDGIDLLPDFREPLSLLVARLQAE
jgi:dTDP-4-dehydrorhamnose reductase